VDLALTQHGSGSELHGLPDDVASASEKRTAEKKSRPNLDSFRPLSVAIKEFEHEYLTRALAATEGKKGRAADLLAISRKNLWDKSPLPRELRR